jgi:hypothetical protein
LAIILSLPLTAAAEEPDDLESREKIQRIELAVHVRGRPAKNSLIQKAVEGRASAEELQELVRLYEELSRLRPGKGALEDWKKDTAEMLAAARSVQAGEALAHARLSRAVDCKQCHSKYKPDYELDGTITVEPGIFAVSAPPQIVRVANISRDRKKIVIYESRIRSDLVHQQVEVEQDGRRKRETVPVLLEKREVVTTSLLMNDVRVLDADGEEMEVELLWKRLAPGALVFRHTGPVAPDPAYFKLLAREALIIVPRPLAGESK